MTAKPSLSRNSRLPHMNFREPLPDHCPPEGAEEISKPSQVYRLVRTDPPTECDFRSQREENPNRQFRDITECQVRGVSVFTDRKDAEERASRLPRFRGYFICRVHLEEGAGYIQKTGQGSHHTWWPLADFDILSRCVVEGS